MLVRLVPQQPSLPGSFRDLPRGEHRHRVRTIWPGLWPRMKWPETQRGIYLWQDGRVLVVESHDDFALFHDADAVIAGGYQWQGEDTDWIAQVLASNGFLLEPVGDAAPTNTFTATFEPTF